MEYRKRDYYLFKILYFIRFFADAMFYGYTTLYLRGLGLKEGIIGTICSITTFTALIANPLWSIAAKNQKIIRLLLFILSMIEGTVIIIYGNVSLVHGIMLLTALAAIAASPFYSMLDGYAESFSEGYGKDYSRIRIMGTLGYVVAVFLCSFIIEKIGYTNTFMISGTIFLLVGALCFTLPKIEKRSIEKKRDYKAILKNKRFWFYVTWYLFIVTLSTVVENYNSIFFTDIIGLTVSQYSYVYLIILLTETVTLFLAGVFLRNAKYTVVLSVAGIIYAMKCFGMSFTSLPIWLLVVFASLRGVAFALILFAHIKNIARQVGLENLTTAVILLASVAGLFSFVMNNIIGYIIENLGYSTVYIADGCIILFFTLLFIITNVLLKKRTVL